MSYTEEELRKELALQERCAALEHENAVLRDENYNLREGREKWEKMNYTLWNMAMKAVSEGKEGIYIRIVTGSLECDGEDIPSR